MKNAVWICVISATIAAAFAARPAYPQDEQGERIVNRECTTCHDLRRIRIQAMDRETWAATVNSMIGKGAKVSSDEIPVVLDYLVARQGPLPDGPGKEILLNTCTLCHDLKRVKEHGATPQQWEETLGAMLNEGAPLSDEEFPVILNYLARNFRPVR